MSNLRNVLIAGQSLGGSVATLLGQLLVYGASKSGINISNSALIIPSDVITVVSINSPGNEYASLQLGFSEAETRAYEESVNPHRLVVWNSKTNTFDFVSQLGGKFSGTNWALPVEIAKSVPELHRNGIGV